ncbi:MAG TPA: hypothetical protein VNO33_18245 [Kofleriaceae bacterium]|nr:hypothetical protein [Kofleriaceae bacterium]
MFARRSPWPLPPLIGRRWLLATVTLAVACSSSPAPRPEPTQTVEAQAPAPAPVTRAAPALPKPDFLELIPADTPFFFAALAPLPAGYAAREYLSRLAAYEKVRPAIERLRQKRPREMKRLGFLVRLQISLLAELGGAVSPEKLASIGLDPSTTGALYGLGMNPVVRIRLSDPKRFAAALDRMAGRLKPIARGELGGQRYYAAREDAVLWIIAVAGRDLVIALLPPAQRAAWLPLLFGQRRPERSLAGDNRLAELAAAHGLSPVGLGYADIGAMAGGLGGPMAAPCHEELKQLAASVPRIAVGLTAASATEMRAHSVVETSPDVARALMSLGGELPASAATAAAAPFEITAGVDMGALITWLSGSFGRIAASPFRCPALDWINHLARSQGGVLRKASRTLAGVRGARLAVREIEGLVSGTTDFFLLLGSDRPAEVLGRLAPALGARAPSIQPGDPAVELASSLGAGFGKVHVALGPRAVALAVGTDGSELAGMVGAAPAPQLPLVSMRVDPQAVAPLLRMGVSAGDPRIAALDRELARNLAEIEVLDLERFDDLTLTVRATARGIEVDLDGRYPR